MFRTLESGRFFREPRTVRPSPFSHFSWPRRPPPVESKRIWLTFLPSLPSRLRRSDIHEPFSPPKSLLYALIEHGHCCSAILSFSDFCRAEAESRSALGHSEVLWLRSDAIIHGVPESLPTADVRFCCLHANPSRNLRASSGIARGILVLQSSFVHRTLAGIT
jgi:hypothetical protein